MFARVIVDITHSKVDKVFDYKILEGQDVQRGSRVLVPFANRKIEGFVMAITENTEVPQEKIKSIDKVLDKLPPLFDEILELAEFIKGKYHATMAEVLRLMIPAEMRGDRVKEIDKTFVRLSGIPYGQCVSMIAKNAKKQLDLLNGIFGGEEDYTLLANAYGYAPIKALEKKGIVYLEKEQKIRTPYEFIETNNLRHTLNQYQQKAIEEIENTNKLVTLIHGVTGSGKTEIYLNLIEKALEAKKSALFLVPEIALTPQMVSQLRGRFNENVAIIHSGLSKGERFDEWWRLRRGEAKICVGARSGIFAPIENIGYIIIDEEHETSYTSETSPRYNTLEVAKFRAKQNGGKIILGSATPSVETYYNAKNGNYQLIEIRERVNKKNMPRFNIVDMKREVKGGNKNIISTTLKEEIEKVIQSKKQAILFLNRRGFSSYYQCQDCGFVAKCTSCDVTLTYHKWENALKCHYCGAKYTIPTVCPECGGEHFKLGSSGTEQVVSEIKKLFPNARILRMDNDTTTTKESHNKILQAFRNMEADILVGTQMVAKGHDFPNVTLVGIINADQSLYYADYRSGERTFQLITQVAGRAGRADLDGQVVLQTYSPRHEIINYATHYDYKAFFDYEINGRKVTFFPPFADVIRVMIVGENESSVKMTTRILYNNIEQLKVENSKTFSYFCGMKCPIKVIENKFRYQIVAKLVGENREDIIQKIYNIVDNNKINGVTSYVEVNPNNMN